MDRIKNYARSSQSGSTSPKGNVSNPYTQEEYDEIIESGSPWTGGYVEGKGYVAPDTYITGSYGWFSWDEFWSENSYPWSIPDCSGSSSSSGGGSSNGSSNNGGSDITHGPIGGSHSGGGSSGVQTPSSSNIDKAFPEPSRHQSTGSCVRVVSVRLATTSVSTLSKFTAVAYDRNGNMIPSTKINGFFLERDINYAEATMSGHNKAILVGDYAIVPRFAENQEFDWYLTAVPGRAGIAIHAGNNYWNSKGCLLPGVSFSFDESKKEYHVWQSGDMLRKLSDLFNEYGHQNIRIIISEDF